MFDRFCLALTLFLLSASVAWAFGPVTITVGGLQRSYLIFGQLNGTPKPLIIMMHGLGGNGLQAAQATHLGQLAPSGGFVAVFPSGLAEEWNHYPNGQADQYSTTRWQQAGFPVPDDAAFIKAIIDRLVGNHNADPKRVYISGFSAGGFMALRLICEDSQWFAAAVLISTGMPDPNGQTCHPTHPLPVLIEKGTADHNVPYAGGLVLDRTFSVWPADQMTTFFAGVDKCSRPPATSNVPGTKLPTELSQYSCGAGPVNFYKVTNGPHVVYQLPPPAPTIWNFVQGHSL